MTPDGSSITGLAFCLAQSDTRGASAQVALWIGVLIVVVVAAGVLLLVVRQKLFAKDVPSHGRGRLLDDLRELKDSGRMSDEEYDAIRRSLVRKAAGADVAAGRDGDRAPGARPAGRSASGSEARTARPGFDLTGERLPGADGSG